MAPDEQEHQQPAARDIHDRKYGIRLHVPAGWEFQRKDGVLSSFHKDVRSAPGKWMLRGVATLNYNPYPYSTFAGAAFYFTVLQHSKAQACTAQTRAGEMKEEAGVTIAGIPFKHGHDQQGTICTESRDDVFTAAYRGSCLRFDLVVNTFCSQTSGAMDLTPKQLGDVDARLANILQSIRLDGGSAEH